MIRYWADQFHNTLLAFPESLHTRIVERRQEILYLKFSLQLGFRI